MSLSQNALISAYGGMVQDHVEAGDDAFLLSFMFNPLPGHDQQKRITMREEIVATYYKVLTRAFRHPNSVPTHEKPIWIALPDMPVFKHGKGNYRDIVVNGGLHYHAIALMPPGTRMKQRLDDWFQWQQRLYSGSNRYLFRIHAVMIESDPEYVVGYGLKALQNGAAHHDDLLLLPHASSERPTRTREERHQAKREGEQRRRALMPQAHDLSDEAAKVISRVGLE